MEVWIPILTSIFGILVIIFIALILIVSLILSRITETQYKKNVIALLSYKKCNNFIEKIENAYNTYRHRRFGFGYMNIIELNQKLTEEIRTEKYKKYYSKNISSIDVANKLDEVVNALKERIRFDDEKTNKLIKKLSSATSSDIPELTQEFRMFISNLNSYNNGRILEKDFRISGLEEKLKRKHKLDWLLGIISLLSSIITIFSIFR